MSAKSKLTFFPLCILFILNLSCESTENRIEYFLSERMKETEAVQKICEDFGNINLNQDNLVNYIGKMGDLKNQFEKSRTDLLKNTFTNIKLEEGRIGSSELDNLGNLLGLSENEKKKLPSKEKYEWELKYKTWLANKKEIQEKIKAGQDVSKEVIEFKQSIHELISGRVNLSYALKLSFTQSLLVVIIHNANQAEKDLDKHLEKLGTLGIVMHSIAREILAEVLAQLVEILIPFIEKKELINPIDITRESCKIYKKYETTPGVSNRLLKRTILRFLKEDNSDYSLTKIYNLNNLLGLQTEAELGKRAGLEKLEKKKDEFLKKISSSQSLMTGGIAICNSDDCKHVSESILKNSLLPSIPSSNLTDQIIPAYDKCLEDKGKCSASPSIDKEKLLAESVKKCIGYSDCSWEMINQDMSWGIWHSSSIVNTMEDFILYKTKFFEKSNSSSDANDALLAKMEELQSTVRVLRNDLVHSLNSSCTGQLDEQRTERTNWLKKLQSAGYILEIKSSPITELTPSKLCSSNENIIIKKDKLNAIVPSSAICSFQPIELSLEIRGLYNLCEYKAPDEDKLAIEVIQLLEILRDSLNQGVFNLHILGFTDDVDATLADCKKKIQKGLNPTDPNYHSLIKDCPKPCEGNIALSHLRAANFRNYIAAKAKLFNGKLEYTAYGLSKYELVDKDTKQNRELNRRIKLKVFAPNSKYGCY